VLDFQILGEGTAADGSPSKRVLLVVAYRDLIANYMEACRLAGIRLLGVDLEAFALLRALTGAFAIEPGGGSDRSALVAVSIGSERSVLGVSDGFSCEYTRVLDWVWWSSPWSVCINSRRSPLDVYTKTWLGVPVK